MRILHTSDWHLGQVFKNQNRYEEHQLFLDWTLDLLAREDYDCLIIAGDVFDVGNPPTEATKQYFNFLVRASQTSLKQIVVIAGNHDFASTIEAPRELLDSIDIRVVGTLGQELQDSIVHIQDSEAQEAKVFCAPYLRAGDLQALGEDETIDQAIRRSIKETYAQGLQLCSEGDFQGLKIATGHLYAAGSEVQDSVRDIQIGKEGQVGVESFGDGYDYVALGHIHKAQIVAGQDHIRYSGAPISLSFSEHQDTKYLIDIQWQGGGRNITMVEVPQFRRLVKIEGSRADVYAAIKKLAVEDTAAERLASWVEVSLPEETPDPYLADEIRETALQEGVRVFGIHMTKGVKGVELEHHKDLNLLEPIDVLKFLVEGREDEEELIQTFKELEQIQGEES